MSYRVHVRVMPRDGLLDPQGQAVEHALGALGFAEAAGVRVGRAIELDVAAGSRAEAESRVRQMCDKLLANPVTEDYLLQVEEAR
ncbi:MAG TPA: phosphoribosylformylglycinamidine synthase subunit PurS [Gemmatimonadales bacterium]|jgi:phosphoribosylformylglycinamidine synthase|nr:phosphoribosylformylglycinamidine synthase subunit PurS [Gemmatimonadales bacterium]